MITWQIARALLERHRDMALREGPGPRIVDAEVVERRCSRVGSTIVNPRSEESVMSTANDVLARDRVVDIVRETLARRSITRAIPVDGDLRDVGLTSLDMVNLMLAVEAEFDLKIPDADMTLRNFRTISAIDALVTSLLRDKALAG
jgi:acyl carrier protein